MKSLLRILRAIFGVMLIGGMSELPGRSQTVSPPPSLYSVLNNTQLVTINATNALVTRTLDITGLPTNWVCGNLTWCPQDCALYGLWYQALSLDGNTQSIFLVRLDPGTGGATTNAMLGTYSGGAGELYEGLVYDDALGSLVVSHRSKTHGQSSDEIGLLASDGSFSLLCNNAADNDVLLYDSRRDLLYMVDAFYNGLELNYFGRVTLANGSVTPVGEFAFSKGYPATYQRSLDCFHGLDGNANLYRWTADGAQPVLIGPVAGIGSSTLAGLAPVPAAPSVVLLAPATTNETVCLTSLPLMAGALAGNAPVLRVDYYDGAALIGSSTNALHSFVARSSALAFGAHSITAQAFDGCFFSATSLVATVVLTPPASNHLAIELSPDGTNVICCLGGATSNAVYTLQGSTNLLDRSTGWLPLSTNTAVSGLVLFTNRLTGQSRYFRSVTPP